MVLLRHQVPHTTQAKSWAITLRWTDPPDLAGFNCPGSTAVIWRRDGRLVGDVKDFVKVAKDMYDIEHTPDEELIKAITAENLEHVQQASQEDDWTPYLGKYKKEWKDGIGFDGTWQKHKPHKGSVTFKDGSCYEGTLKDGLFHGQGVIRYENGAKFVGINNRNLHTFAVDNNTALSVSAVIPEDKRCGIWNM